MRFAFLLLLSATALLAQTAQSVAIVPATASLVLAGAPDGATVARGYSSRDRAPVNSPTEIRDVVFTTGALMTFTARGVTGIGNWPIDADHEAGIPAEGFIDSQRSFSSTYLTDPATSGIGQVSAPLNSLIGVFLSDDVPSDSPPPAPVEFGSTELRNTVQRPQLKQPFFIGSGWAAPNRPRQICVPPRATRLFLGILSQENASSSGSLEVVWTLSPAPTARGGSARLTNTSTRVFVGAGENVTVTGLAVRGSGTKSFLVRAIGPSLGTLFGLTNTLLNPRLTLHDGTGTMVATVRGWDPLLVSNFVTAGAFALPANSGDAATVFTLAEGNYTIVVSGDPAVLRPPNPPTQGIALVEVYELP